MVAMKIFPETWTRDTWARAAWPPSLPAVEVVDGHMVSTATTHEAVYAGQDKWTVDYLPGRLVDAATAEIALRIAQAPGAPQVERWAARLGLTANEARLLVAGAVA